MATPTALQALSVLSVLAILVAEHVEGRHHRYDCPSFACGTLRNISSPFRQAGDPPGCGYRSYELVCSDSKATIRINDAKYYVSDINYSDSSFSVVYADFDLYNHCPLPVWNRLRPYESTQPGIVLELYPIAHNYAIFIKCSQEVKNNGMYMPVTCMSTNCSFVYVLTGRYSYLMDYLEPSCGYLAETPLGFPAEAMENVSYADVIKFMRYGITVRFPWRYHAKSIKGCLMTSIKYCRNLLSRRQSAAEILLFDGGYFPACAFYVLLGSSYTEILYMIIAVTTSIVTWIAVLCRFLLAPLAVLIFLAHKYWKTRITIDAVEKFLRMQQVIGPTRYSYTDIVAITSHFRDKLGQGGYGSVYKGVLLPGNVNIAIKMLEGNSNCNGEDFINEVSTIGTIHHVNVVHLVGFCSEAMTRALVYEYMPRGSLDKYIFSSEKSFSWDKLNEIALGIARGINYLHHGCDMQILHFDIKPHNILLDENFVPKVADFGLAKLYPRGNNFVPLSALRGTVGYIAPEMISRSFGVISSKSDVYSFGMLLLEMAGGRRNADPNAASSSQAYYPSWVYDRLTEQEVDEISVVTDMHELEKKLCIVGLWCIQMRSNDRPAMSEVIEMLEAGVDGLQMPSRPFFCDEAHIHVECSYHLSSDPISEEDE